MYTFQSDHAMTRTELSLSLTIPRIATDWVLKEENQCATDYKTFGL